MGGEGAEAGIFDSGFLGVIGNIDEAPVVEGGTGAEIFDVIADRDADFCLAVIAEEREGQRNAAAMIEAEDENMMLASQLKDGRQVVLAARVGGLGLGVEAQDAVTKERSDRPFGVFFVFDEIDGAGPFADGQGLDEFLFDADTPGIGPAGLGWLCFRFFHAERATVPLSFGNARLGSGGKKALTVPLSTPLFYLPFKGP